MTDQPPCTSMRLSHFQIHHLAATTWHPPLSYPPATVPARTKSQTSDPDHSTPSKSEANIWRTASSTTSAAHPPQEFLWCNRWPGPWCGSPCWGGGGGGGWGSPSRLPRLPLRTDGIRRSCVKWFATSGICSIGQCSDNAQFENGQVCWTDGLTDDLPTSNQMTKTGTRDFKCAVETPWHSRFPRDPANRLPQRIGMVSNKSTPRLLSSDYHMVPALSSGCYTTWNLVRSSCPCSFPPFRC